MKARIVTNISRFPRSRRGDLYRVRLEESKNNIPSEVIAVAAEDLRGHNLVDTELVDIEPIEGMIGRARIVKRLGQWNQELNRDAT